MRGLGVGVRIRRWLSFELFTGRDHVRGVPLSGCTGHPGWKAIAVPLVEHARDRDGRCSSSHPRDAALFTRSVSLPADLRSHTVYRAVGLHVVAVDLSQSASL